jgi:uncharacterized membrane protein
VNLFTTADIAARIFRPIVDGLCVTLERTSHGANSLNARMSIYREVWVRRILDREARMVDMQIMASLQNGTAFFASTTLLAIGGGLTLLRSTEEAMSVLATLPLGIRSSPALWEIKCVGLIVIFVYAFSNSHGPIACSTTSPSCSARCRSPKKTPEAQSHVMRTTKLFQSAGRHFNRGQRAFLFALGYLGWFISPWV